MFMAILIVEGCGKVYRKSGNIAVVSKSKFKKQNNEELIEVPVPDIELVVLVGGYINVTTSALITLLANGIPVVVLSGKSEVYGVLFDVIQVGTINIREVQYRCFSSEQCKVKYAKFMIASKLKGLYNVLRYEYKYHKENLSEDVYEYSKSKILSAIENINRCTNLDELRLTEAEGSKAFWEVATKFIPEKYNFTGRDPRKGDSINSALNFIYSIIYGLIVKSLVSVGLDPFYGVMHKEKPGRLTLVYDMSEILKPLAIHAVIQTSRKANISTLRGSKLLTVKSIEALTSRLYSKLSEESERMYKRRSIWQLPLHEATKLKDAIIKETQYTPYTYNPSD